MQDTLNRATALVSEAESRLDEISIQLSVIQKQCTYRDRPLCDTIHIKNMDESGLNLKFKKVIFFMYFCQLLYRLDVRFCEILAAE